MNRRKFLKMLGIGAGATAIGVKTVSEIQEIDNKALRATDDAEIPEYQYGTWANLEKASAYREIEIRKMLSGTGLSDAFNRAFQGHRGRKF